ncbi:MAG: hypothetical protein M3145_01120, partial [Pseudomonadota bacterium]|nr:hypothetical protein [Pseudomonadota bacterium]
DHAGAFDQRCRTALVEMMKDADAVTRGYRGVPAGHHELDGRQAGLSPQARRGLDHEAPAIDRFHGAVDEHAQKGMVGEVGIGGDIDQDRHPVAKDLEIGDMVDLLVGAGEDGDGRGRSDRVHRRIELADREEVPGEGVAARRGGVPLPAAATRGGS